MEGLNSSGVTVVGSDAPRTENPSGSTPAETPQVVFPPPAVAPLPETAVVPVKKKRGRPRKYGPDGSVTKALSPKPISSAPPPSVIDFSAAKPRGKFRPFGSASKHFAKMGMESLGYHNEGNIFFSAKTSWDMHYLCKWYIDL